MAIRLLSGAFGSWILLGAATTPVGAFALRSTGGASQRFAGLLTLQAAILDVRGGGETGDSHLFDPLSIQGDAAVVANLPTDSLADDSTLADEDDGDDSVALAGSVPPMSLLLTAFARFYSAQIQTAPIRTKSITAGVIFGLSDYLAQRLANRSSKDDEKEMKALDWTRLWTSVGVGFLYFGPAAHYWYEVIFRIFPGTGLFSTLQKAALGQLLFGPSFTCIFFAASLWQAGKLTFANWVTKIRDDLPGAWVAGLGFWPLVDLISYSLVPKDYIPLFVNACSLVWTIYLSLVANR